MSKTSLYSPFDKNNAQISNNVNLDLVAEVPSQATPSLRPQPSPRYPEPTPPQPPSTSATMIPEPAPQLSLGEWSAVVTIIAFLGLLTFCVILGRYESLEGIPVEKGYYLKAEKVEVYVGGAVKKPGSYSLKAGSLVKEAIALAEPAANADLKKMREGSKVRNGQSITVPAREMITISVSGAIQEACEMTVPKGTRLHELCQYLPFTEDADLAKMDSKRCIKAGEKIIVPVKGAKRQNRVKQSGK